MTFSPIMPEDTASRSDTGTNMKAAGAFQATTEKFANAVTYQLNACTVQKHLGRRATRAARDKFMSTRECQEREVYISSEGSETEQSQPSSPFHRSGKTESSEESDTESDEVPTDHECQVCMSQLFVGVLVCRGSRTSEPQPLVPCRPQLRVVACR